MYWIILIGFMLIGFLVQNRLKAKFQKYSQISLHNGLSGKEIAEKMLHDHGIYDVQVISTPGQLTDHYNPKDKTVNLSDWVYDQRSVAAAAVAAHEVGHAVQHAKAYSWLSFRSAMVPIVSFSSRMMQYIFIAMLLGAFVINMFPFDYVIYTMIALQATITLFSVVTLPVEYDASNRALAWMQQKGITGHGEHAMAKDALNSAANTYVVGALASITQLAYYLSFLGGDD
ncbi:zinc metallopeptidase [Croceimicrobium sp.]|uniref:zinc metallopeptidase n=1 Tax=Croceimicrobium sp. TaxID=2828340 RepID=UPI003BA86CE4